MDQNDKEHLGDVTHMVVTKSKVSFNDFGYQVDSDGIKGTLVRAMEYSANTGVPIVVDQKDFYISLAQSPKVVIDKAGVVKQERYQGKSGEDLIDRWAREETPEMFRAKIMAQLDRYTSRYGKKDDVLKEAKKIQDYANRLVAYEESLIKLDKD